MINRKKQFYMGIEPIIDLFDLGSMDSVIKSHPGFKLESMYLAGGMDKAENSGKGWRLELESEFLCQLPDLYNTEDKSN